jgi:hypothetical protein
VDRGQALFGNGILEGTPLGLLPEDRNFTRDPFN